MSRFLVFILFAGSVQAAQVRFAFTNHLGVADTNSFRVVPIGSVIQSDGSFITRGRPTLLTPSSDGKVTNSFQVGHYQVTNQFIPSGFLIRVPDDSSATIYDATSPTNLGGLAMSGYNTFVTVDPTSNGVVTALGFAPLKGVAAGSNVTAVTNGGLVTISSTGGGSATNAISNSAGFGTNTTIITSLTVSGEQTNTGSIAIDGSLLSGGVTINGSAVTERLLVTDTGSSAMIGDGLGLTNLNATQLANGTVPDARLSSNVPLKNAANFFTVANNRFESNLRVTNSAQVNLFMDEIVTAGPLFRIGIDNTTTGAGGMVMGGGNAFGGDGGGVFGFSNIAAGQDVHIFGGSNTGKGSESIFAGWGNTSTNDAEFNHVVIGAYNSLISDGEQRVVVGNFNRISATGALVLGNSVTNSTASSVEIGPANANKLRISSSGVNWLGSGSFTGVGSGLTAVNAETVTVADSTDATSSVCIFDSATGNLAPKTDAGLTYNASSGTLTATAFTGPLAGNVTGNLAGNADTATLAGTVTVVDGTDSTSFVGIYDNATGSLAPKTDGALLYNASSGALAATSFSGVGTALTALDDDAVNFDDGDNLWTATAIGPALEEMNESINAGVPNGSGAKVHWSQLLGVPAGFADNTDDGGGGGDADAIHDNVGGEIAAITDKAIPVAADHLLIEDSEASNAKKDTTIGGQETALEGVMDLQDMQGAVTDGQVPNNITVDLATLASTVTVVDGTDSTSFVAIFDSATGSLPVKTDGALLYNASTGELSATTYSGAGGGLTLDASGFNGNLATTDNTLQEVAQKVDDLSFGSFWFTNGAAANSISNTFYVKATALTVETNSIKQAWIGDLTVTNALTVDSVNATTLNVDNANIDNYNVTDFNATNFYAQTLYATNLYAQTNLAAYTSLTNEFVVGTRYTNAAHRALVSASFHLISAVGGTPKLSLKVEQGNGITNIYTIQGLTNIVQTTMQPIIAPLGPTARFTFVNESSGGASANIISYTSSYNVQ